jgi:putative ABC transport system permease protein
VQAAALSGGLPGARSGFNYSNFAIEGQSYLKDRDYPGSRLLNVTPKFFATLGTPVVSGRAFTEADRDGSLPVVLVNRAFAAKHFEGDPVGKRIRLGGEKSTAPWLTVVGVVADMFSGDQEEPMPPAMFRPFAQQRSTFVYISAKTNGPPMSITPAVRDVVTSLNADIPLYWVSSFEDAIAQSLWFVRVFGTMFMIFGFVALFLASVGLYAVMSFSVSRRTREVGIRMALGAQGRDVVRMVFGQGLVQLAVGMTLGLTLALTIAQLMKVVLFQVQPRDPAIFGGVAAVLVAVGLIACFVPARRATLVDPLVALRAD